MIFIRAVEICHVCDRAYVMREGRIAGHLSRAELTEENLVRLVMHHPEAASFAQSNRCSGYPALRWCWYS